MPYCSRLNRILAAVAKTIAINRDGHLLLTRLITKVITNVAIATNNVGICVSISANGNAIKRSINPEGKVVIPNILLIWLTIIVRATPFNKPCNIGLDKNQQRYLNETLLQSNTKPQS